MTRKSGVDSAGTQSQRSLLDLLDGIEYRSAGTAFDHTLMVDRICVNSRKARPLSCYVAIKGSAHDGHDFLIDVAAAGAAAVVVQKDSIDTRRRAALNIPVIEVDDTRAFLAALVSVFYRNPAAEMTMIGITGTNGKTTVSYLIEQALQGLGFKTGVIGTIEYRYKDLHGNRCIIPAPLTTPDPLTLQAILREMADNGVTHVMVETSSHALEQRRLDSIGFDLALFTNLSQDHLDYHQTMENYFAAKCLLFERLVQPAGSAVITSITAEAGGEDWPAKVVEVCRRRSLKTVVCGTEENSDLRLVDYSTHGSGVNCRLADRSGEEFVIESPLIGRFNVTNLLTAFGALSALGCDQSRSARLLGAAQGAPGRIAPVELAEKAVDQPRVIVDYAHTPDALEKVLSALKALGQHRLVCVFGCGGDRDKSKRFLMGAVAARFADLMIVTDDNPRTEEPSMIRKSIIEGIEAESLGPCSSFWPKSRQGQTPCYIEIGDRERAIAYGVNRSGPDDVVLIAGKGHEAYQTVGTANRFFDDTLSAQQAGLVWDLETVAAATGGNIVQIGTETHFGSVSTDTRSIAEGDIFVALSGENFDGHEFIEQAAAGGARCLVVSDIERVRNRDICCVQVNDTLKALGDLANDRLNRVRQINRPVVIGLTGSCGKTTVKEMTAAILSCRWPERQDRPADRVLKTAGNFNNLIGLPLSLLPVSVHHRALVLEMGMNRPGEIGRLTDIADPDICCITNVHQAHLEGLGSIEGVAAAKGEIFEQCRADSVKIINLDDPHILELGTAAGGNIIGYGVTKEGLSHNPEVWAEEVTADENGSLSFVLHVRDQRRSVVIDSPGLHNASNCCAAAAIAHAAGINFDSIVEGLSRFRSASNRMERLISAQGLRILNDSYNANPASVASGLRTLGKLPSPSRVAILGDMLELGEASDNLHRSVGNVAAQSDLSFLGLVGNFAEQIKQGALTSGMDPERIRVFGHKDEVADWVRALMKTSRLHPGDWLLVKASRGLALDTVVDQIMEQC